MYPYKYEVLRLCECIDLDEDVGKVGEEEEEEEEAA